MNPEMASMAFKMVTALGATLLVFGLAAMVLRKVQSGGGLKGLTGRKSPAKGIEILHHSALAPGRSLHVVRCMGKTLLVGSTSSGISLLSELEDALESDDFGSTLIDNLRDKSASSLKRQVAESLENVSRV